MECFLYASHINIICLQIYEKLAVKLTDWGESHMCLTLEEHITLSQSFIICKYNYN